MKIIHAADLHLTQNSEDRLYGLGVLKEIRDLVIRHDAAVLVLAGDIFDSFPDLQELKSEFLEILAPLKTRTRIFYLPGNHEHLQKGTLSLDKLDFDFVTLLSQEPYTFISLPGLELIGIPYQRDYGDFLSWTQVPKSEEFRLICAHGALEGATFMGFNKEEADDSVLDTAIFKHLLGDGVALGHIHSGRIVKSPPIGYSGSARVWRKGETGPRRVLLWDTKLKKEPEELILTSAGQYYQIIVPLSLDSTPGQEPLWDEFSAHDWLDIVFKGLVEDEKQIQRVKERWETKLNDRFRRLSFSFDVQVLGDISSHAVTQGFLKKWKELEPGADSSEEDRRVWYAAREIGLLQLNKVLPGGRT